MYDDELIIKFMPKLQKMAAQYANDQCDEDELVSEGQLMLLEYLSNRQDIPNNILYNKAYNSVSKRLKTFATSKLNNAIDTVSLNDCIIMVSQHYACDPEKLLQLLENILTEREFTIITNYYGIISDEKTCEELTKMFDLSISRISAIKRHAERKLKHYFHNRQVNLYDLI